jgi:site-specific DNA recombinase
MLWLPLFVFYMEKKQIKYFIYARKSTEGDSRQVLSIDGQLEDLKKLVSRENLVIVDTISEKRSAATPFNRPAYSEMIARIKKGQATGVVVWHIDRLARNHLEAGEFQYLLQIGAIQSVWTMSREYQSNDNGLLFSLETSVATQYSRDLSEKVRRGLLQKCKLGQPPIFAPLGYINTKYSVHGTNLIVEDPERWHIVRKGFDLLLSKKYNTPQIAHILFTEYGLRSRPSGNRGGRPLNKSVLYRIFTDPFYFGHFYYKGTLYKGVYKPMITVEEFDQVQEILGRKFKAKPQKHEFAFTGFIKCGSCGCAVTASAKAKEIKTTGEDKIYTFYHCTKRKGKNSCSEKHYTTIKEMELMIEKELSGFHIEPEFKQWAIRILKENYAQEIDKQKELISEAATHEQKTLKELDILIDMRLSNQISEDKYLQKKTEKEGQLIRVQEKRARLETGQDDSIERLIGQLEFAVNAVERFKSRVINDQRDVCMNFGWNWSLTDKKLIIDKFKWIEPIRNYADTVAGYFGRSEPQKVFDRYGENASLEILRPIVRRLRDDVRTENRQSIKRGRNKSM